MSNLFNALLASDSSIKVLEIVEWPILKIFWNALLCPDTQCYVMAFSGEVSPVLAQ